MKKLLFSLTLIIFLFNLTSCMPKDKMTKVSFKKNDQTLGELTTFIALTPEEHAQGLRDIEKLPENIGMLFIFENPGERMFVMGNVKIPLDIIFVDENKKISKIYEAPSCLKTDAECDKYPSLNKILYTVETNMGWTKKHGIKEGDMIEISNNK